MSPRTVATPLSRERVLRAAFEQGDAEGLESVTMRSVAGRLGVEAMSLYNHVPNKKAMLDGLVDLLVQVAALPTGELTVEQWIRGTATGMRALAQQHPRMVPLFSRRPVPLDDPVSARPFESGLAAFVREGRDVAQGFSAVQGVLLSVLALAQLEATAQSDPVPDNATALAALSAEEFPLLAQVQALDPGLADFWQTLTDALVRGLTSPPHSG